MKVIPPFFRPRFHCKEKQKISSSLNIIETSTNIDKPLYSDFVGSVVNNKWTVKKLISKSSNCKVYLGVSKNGSTVAIKIGRAGALVDEMNIYNKFHHEHFDWGIPEIKYNNQYDNVDVLVMEALGPNLDVAMSNRVGSPLPLSIVLMIAEHLIYRLETIHNSNVVHGKVEPRNILIGEMERASDTVFLADYSHAEHKDQGDQRKELSVDVNNAYDFLSNFASIASHNSDKRFRRDDLESLMYVIAYIGTGTLPWIDLTNINEKVKAKSQVNLEELFSGLPTQFLAIMKNIKSLDLKQKPDYAFLRKLLRNTAIE